jgi:hypothetical protein
MGSEKEPFSSWPPLASNMRFGVRHPHFVPVLAFLDIPTRAAQRHRLARRRVTNDV